MDENNLSCGGNQPSRKGYSRRADIPLALTGSLNRGEIETATLAEQLAVDFLKLLRALDGWKGDREAALAVLRRHDIASHGILKRMQLAAAALGHHGGFHEQEALLQLMRHRSDMVRGVGCYVIGTHPALNFQQKLEWLRPLAADHHFGVREWAWLALRPEAVASPQQAIALLQEWASDRDANIRRFAVEVTRPRGVWARHIPLLRQQPQHGLPILEPCSNDVSRYVQNSVANWLNDAAKDHPAWVRKVCRGWLKLHPGDRACGYITRRAQRSIPE